MLRAAAHYNTSLPFPNVPSTDSQCGMLIPLAAGVQIQMDYDHSTTTIYTTPTTRAQIAQEMQFLLPSAPPSIQLP
eukprot:4672905-Pleurochrysis_carterae.AAC.1